MGWSEHGTSAWPYAAMGGGLLAVVALVVLIALLISRRAPLRPAITGSPAAATPQGLLDARLARGEIDEAEYASRREALAAKAGT